MAKTFVDTDGLQELTGKSVNSINLMQLGAVPNGVADCSGYLLTAVQTLATRGGGEIVLPITSAGRTYRFLSGLPTSTIGNYITFRGVGMPLLSKEFNGDFFPLIGGQAFPKFIGLEIDANGDAYTGSVIRFGSGASGFG